MIWNALSTSLADVTAVATVAGNPSLADGDAVIIPAGTSVWTSYVPVDKAISVIGAGIGSTIIQDSISNTSGAMFSLNAAPGKVIRVSGLEFQPGTQTSFNSGAISTGSLGNVRIDHCKFNGLYGNNISAHDIFGVIDHCDFQIRSNTIAVDVAHGGWGGGTYGDKSYADLSYLGTDKFIFIEDNTFTGAAGGNPKDAIDGLRGGRLVFRHNICDHAIGGTHGTESGGRQRGFRAIEVYNNTFTNGSPFGSLPNMRSGTGVYYNNTATGFANPVYIQLGDFREIGSFGVFVPEADGTSGWDVNDTTDHTGNGLGGGANGLYASGTVASASSLTMTVSGTPWTTNQWVNFTIRKTAGSGGAQLFSTIRSNTNNTITFTAGFSGNLTFTAGDSWQIRKIIHSLDQPGRVRGSQISGDTPTIPGGWNDQVTEPYYQWNNLFDTGGQPIGSYTGVILFSGNAAGSVTGGVHYIDSTSMPGYTAYTYPHPLLSIAPIFTSANNASFVAGTGGTFQVSASGTIPITFSLVSGSWPSGTSMNSSGLITVGVSTVAGVYSVTLGATNGVAPDATQGFTLIVTANPGVPVRQTSRQKRGRR